MRVIYVMGEGRSGSTILDMLLSSAPGAVGVGEVWSFLADDPRTARICSCGATFRECPFWDRVRETLLAEMDLELPAIRAVQQHQDSYRQLLVSLARGPRVSAEYRRIMSTLFGAIGDLSDCHTVVDSTKLIGRALALSACPDIDLRVIHLVRDCRGVVWSRLRDRTRDRTNEGISREKGPWESIRNWVVKNGLALAAAERLGDRYTLVRYEDMVERPYDTLETLQAHTDLSFAPILDQLRTGTTVHLGDPGHHIGGNYRARARRHTLSLRPDYAWTAHLPWRFRVACAALGGAVAYKLGYRLMSFPRRTQSA